MEEVTVQEFLEAAKEVFDLVPLQARKPSYNAPPFWATPLNVTRARPIPVGAVWVDFLTVPLLADHARVLSKMVATCQQVGAVEFRWLINGHLMDATQVNMPPAVDRHLNRTLAAPYPCTYRRLPVRFGSIDQVRLQAQNLTAQLQLAFASVQGWYYPTLGSVNEITRGEGVDDAARSA